MSGHGQELACTYRLDAGSSTLLLAARGDGLSVLYLGRFLSRPAGDAAAALLEPGTAHGELDVPSLVPCYPGDTGIAGLAPALAVSVDGVARRIDLAVDTVNERDKSLTVHMTDRSVGMGVELTFTATDSGVYESTATLCNVGGEAISVDFMASLHLAVPHRCDELLRCGGFWANEFQCVRERVGASRLTVESLRGRSSHGSSPALLLGEPGFSEERGDVFSAALCWSGDHSLSVSPARDGSLQLLAAVPLRAGDLVLLPGQSFTAPQALFAYSRCGMNGVRRQHQLYWSQGKGGSKPEPVLPVHFNSWEACYFDHDERSMLGLISEAASLGAERFVLDDGWMRDRTGIGCGLGDWVPCPRRYPRGLGPLAAYAREHGMGFGLWIEPEMVTADSEVFRRNPQWVLAAPNVQSITGRGQLLLDISQEQVQQHILQCVDRLVADCQPEYLKWDMNRDYAQTGVESGASSLALHLGFRRVLSEVRERYPQLTIDICAAGGARADAGALKWADRLWPSDSMDPLQRFAIHRTASLWLPMARLGAHVGSACSATSGRTTPLATRCAVAMMGFLGLELDPTTLEEEERGVLEFWLEIYRKARGWLATAERRFLDDCDDGLQAMLAWDDQVGHGMLWVVRDDYPSRASPGALRLPLDVDVCQYRMCLLNPENSAFAQSRSPFLNGESVQVSGDWLASGGFRLPRLQVDHCAVFEIVRHRE